MSDTMTAAPAIRILSMGWGRQTWTLAAMMALGELPRADYIIHADTTHERQATYGFRRQWEPWLIERGLAVVTVTGGRTGVVREDWGRGGIMIPAFTQHKTTEAEGQSRRQCTHDWKVMPIRRFVRAELALRGVARSPGVVEMMMGISLDEWQRMRTSDVRYIINVYPLVERRMRVSDCLAWLEAHGLPAAPRSACTFCPYQSRVRWQAMKREDGPDWAEALAVDAAIRDRRPMHGPLYVHVARRPLAEAVSIPEDVGAEQLGFDALCDGGVCGV